MRTLVAILVAGILVGCSSESATGPAVVEVLQPRGANCAYELLPYRLETLENLEQMKGQLGSLVATKKRIAHDEADSSILNNFKRLDLSFFNSGDTWYPRDFASMVAANLYYALELAHTVHSQISATGNMVSRVSDFGARTFIVYDADIIEEGGNSSSAIVDNAEYLPLYGASDSTPTNLLVTYPTRDQDLLPLDLNVGILAHEYTHSIFHLSFDAVRGQNSSPLSDAGAAAIGSLDEGIADYFGYLTTQDPDFMSCTFPGANRNLAVRKSFDASFAQRIANDPDYDTHEGGAVFASIFYAAGQSVGHDVVAKGLHKLLDGLATCAGNSPTLGQLANCHMQAAGAAQSVLQQYYGGVQ